MSIRAGKSILLLGVLCLLLIRLAAYSQTINDRWLNCSADGVLLAFEPLCPEGTQLLWSGGSKQGKAHGIGIMEKYFDGKLMATFSGTYIEGVAAGCGRLSISDSAIYEGEFMKGQPCGIMLVHKPNGDKFMGRVIHFSLHGYGVYEFADSSRFEGIMAFDKPYSGKFSYPSGQVRYIDGGVQVKKAPVVSRFDSSMIGKPVFSYLDANGYSVKSKNAVSIRKAILDSSLLPATEVELLYPNKERKGLEHYLFLDLDNPYLTFKDGPFVSYHPNGRIRSEGSYRRNQYHGILKEYDDMGNLIRYSVHSLGIPDGDFVEYYPGGEVKSYAYFHVGELREEKFLELDKVGRQSLVRKENFGRHKYLWESGTEHSGSVVLDTGSLLIKINDAGRHYRFNNMEVDGHSDYVISASVRRVKGTEITPYGLLFEFSDWDNYMQFLIADNGSFIVFGKRDGQDMFLTDWQQTKFVKEAGMANLLEVKKTATSLNYYINGEQVGATRYKESTGSLVGVLAAGKGEYEFNKLMVREYLPVTELSGKRNDPNLVKAK